VNIINSKKAYLSSYIFEIMQLDMFLYGRNTLDHVIGVKKCCNAHKLTA
jgi:hypothetical protein